MTSQLSIKAVRGEEFARKFIRNVGDLGDWGQIEPLFKDLAGRIGAIATAGELEQWLLDCSELDAALEEEMSRRYIAMTCNTEDKALEQAYLDYLENIVPRIKPWHDRLGRRYLDSPARQALDRERMTPYDRALENQVRLFREENIELQTEDSKLGQQYQKICGAMMVNWHGQEMTLQQMAPLLEETGRETREEAWRVITGRRLQDAAAVDDLLNKMIAIRTRIARNAGFENFRDYQHQAYNRFDYTPDDCLKFHEAIEQEIVPLLGELRRQRREKLGVGSLRPWDLAVDPENRPPLRPFKTAEQLKKGCAEVFRRVSPLLAGQFETMIERGLLDLDSRKGKAPGGYQSTLQEVRLPFIFMNSAGTNRDVFTLLHEGGHAFHAFASRQEPLVDYRSAPIEFCEVASMSMEMFGMRELNVFYNKEGDNQRAIRRHLEELIDIFPWIATIDAFQHWLYLNPDHSPEERQAKWLEIEARFSPETDWSGLEREHASLWQRQLHIFEVPFYYVEYGIAQMGALQMWLQFRQDRQRAIEHYERALALGGSRPLPQLFEAAGIRFDFSAETLRPVMQAVAEELAGL